MSSMLTAGAAMDFAEACELLSEALDRASFVAIDGEFTGLHCKHKPNLFDSLEERYHKLKKGSLDFLLVQFGLCVFKYDGEKSRYTAYPFNFYVFPRPVNRHAPDVRFLCQSSCIDFLALHNFDFNKVFRDGIPFLTSLDQERLKDLVLKRHSEASEEEKKKIDQLKLQTVLDEVDEAAGFAKVIQMLSSSKRTIVGHNMMLDVMHTLHQFSGPLPETVDDFKAMTHCVFNKIIDTKVLATLHPLKDLLPFSSLGDLKNLLSQTPFEVQKIVMAENFPEYSAETEQLHEAGYDAYITGLCFATMANYLGSLVKTPPKGGRVSPTSQLMEPFMNKCETSHNWVQNIDLNNLAALLKVKGHLRLPELKDMFVWNEFSLLDFAFPVQKGGMASDGRMGSDYISKTGHHVRMRGIPFAATQQDIREFFSGTAQPSSIIFGFNEYGQKNGEANVEFATHKEACAAMGKDREYIGPRYIELFLHSKPSMIDKEESDKDYNCRMEPEGGQKGPEGGIGGDGRIGSDYISNTGHHVHMRGIPFAATQQDIRQFFSGAAQPTSIVFCLNEYGQKNGEADVEFATLKEACAAMGKDREYIGPRYIELFLHSKPSMIDKEEADKDCNFRIVQPDRSHVFHITFPAEWKISDIQNLFSSVRPIMISWINDCSAYVALNRRDLIHRVADIPSSPNYTIMGYAEFKHHMEYLAAFPHDIPSVHQADEQMEYMTTPCPAEVACVPQKDELKINHKGMKRSHDSIQDMDRPDDEVTELTQGEAKKQNLMNSVLT